MLRRSRHYVTICLFAFVCFSNANGGDWRGHYCAVIGPHDRVSSHGFPLGTVSEIIRQDRANYHEYEIRDRGDHDDSFFTNVQRRALIKEFIEPGTYSERDRILIEETELELTYCLYFEGYDFPEIKRDGSKTSRMDIDVISHIGHFTR